MSTGYKKPLVTEEKEEPDREYSKICGSHSQGHSYSKYIWIFCELFDLLFYPHFVTSLLHMVVFLIFFNAYVRYFKYSTKECIFHLNIHHYYTFLNCYFCFVSPSLTSAFTTQTTLTVKSPNDRIIQLKYENQVKPSGRAFPHHHFPHDFKPLVFIPGHQF